MIFDESYTQYWREAVATPVDGIQIAGEGQVRRMLETMSIESSDKVLDLGCSYGRLFQVLNHYSDNIYGVDPDGSAVSDASNCAYKEAKIGTCEEIPFEDSYFNHIICWAVFEVVNQEKCLVEANRTLLTGGKFLLSGKNSNYLWTDNAAFTAEKNAYLKGFSQSFTDVKILIGQLSMFGFRLNQLHTFPARGDMAIDLNGSQKDLTVLDEEFYEFVLVLEKTEIVTPSNLAKIEEFSFEFSNTCSKKAHESNFDNESEYLHSIGIN
jgi:SAM-dependent methyltransferase